VWVAGAVDAALGPPRERERRRLRRHVVEALRVEEAARPQQRAQEGLVRAAVERAVGRQEGLRCVGEPRRGSQRVLRLDDQPVGGLAAELRADVPERARPRLAGAVHLEVALRAASDLRDAEVEIDAPQARHAERRRPPLCDAGRERRRRRLVGGHGGGEVVAEPFADGAALLRLPEARHLVLLDRVAVLVDDRVGVLPGVHTARPEADLVREGIEVRVGLVGGVGDDLHRCAAQQVREPEGLEVRARPVDVDVGHHRLEPWIRACDRPEVGVGRAGEPAEEQCSHPLSCEAAVRGRQALDGYRDAERGEQWRIRVVVVGETFRSAEGGDGVRVVDERLAGRSAEPVGDADDDAGARLDEHLVARQWPAGRDPHAPDEPAAAGGVDCERRGRGLTQRACVRPMQRLGDRLRTVDARRRIGTAHVRRVVDDEIAPSAGRVDDHASRSDNGMAGRVLEVAMEARAEARRHAGRPQRDRP
jgi:hypothetical protein